MKVLFKTHVVNVGHPGDIKDVKPGYAANCLFPQGYAVELTPDLEKKLKSESKNEDKHRRELIMKRHDIVEKLEGKKIHFTLKTGSNGKVFGAIGEKDVLLLLKKDFHIELSKKHIVLPSGHIKALGESFIYIKLGKDAMAKMTVCIVAEQ